MRYATQATSATARTMVIGRISADHPQIAAVWYDDASSLSYKYDLVLGESLAGIGIWALGYDGSRPELWAALADAFGEALNSVELPGSGALEPAMSLRLAGPNPFHEETRFVLELGMRNLVTPSAHVPTSASLAVLDVRGRLVRQLLPIGTIVTAPLRRSIRRN